MWFCLRTFIVHFDIVISLALKKHIGDLLSLVWGSNRSCTIEIQEIDVKVVVQTFDKVDKAHYKGIEASETSCVSSRLTSC